MPAQTMTFNTITGLVSPSNIIPEGSTVAAEPLQTQQATTRYDCEREHILICFKRPLATA